MPLRPIRAIFPWRPPRYALSGTFKGQLEQKSVGGGGGKAGGGCDSDSTDQLILTLCLWCGTQAPAGGAELWAEKAQQAHSNDA